MDTPFQAIDPENAISANFHADGAEKKIISL